MAIAFQSFAGGLAIVTSDTADNSWEAIYVGGTGDLTVTTELGDTCLFKAVPVGTIIPIRTVKVKATGTSATLLTGLR